MEELLNRFEYLDMNKSDSDNQHHNLITKLLSEIENDYQSEIVLKLFCGYYGSLYLSDYSKEEGNIYILGARNASGRKVYTINLCKEYKSLTCSCKDFLYRGKTHGTVCKHITFLVCKVGYILDPQYFETKKLTDIQYEHLISVLDNNIIWKNRRLSVKNINKEFENKVNFQENDLCSICYEPFGNISLNVSCPQCKNYIHKKCMDVWLETNNNCVYCRCYSWKNYIKDIKYI